MKDNVDKRLDRLFEIAREERIDTGAAEECFETRLLARIRELRNAEPWYAVAWRMVPLFTAIAAFIAICTITLNPSRKSDMFAAITDSHEVTLAGAYLAGE